MNTTQKQLIESLIEVLELHPDWRLGQLIANLTDRTKQSSSQASAAEAIWDIEDDDLLASARQFVEQRRRQLQPTVPETGNPSQSSVSSQANA